MDPFAVLKPNSWPTLKTPALSLYLQRVKQISQALIVCLWKTFRAVQLLGICSTSVEIANCLV
jgi:hypothetical protein